MFLKKCIKTQAKNNSPYLKKILNTSNGKFVNFKNENVFLLSLTF